MYNASALDKFKANHDILKDVQIEQSGPNEDPNLVEENENRIPIRIWKIHQAGLWFPIIPLLKEVMAFYRLTFMQVSVNFVRTVLVVDTLMYQQDLPFSALDLLHVYIVVRPTKDPDTHLFKGHHYFQHKNLCQPQVRIVTDSPNKDVYLNEFV